jgi:hypothetical protein
MVDRMKQRLVAPVIISTFLISALWGCGSTSPEQPALPAPGPSGEKALTVVVAVIDSLMPTDLDATAMPNVTALYEGGTLYRQSRSVFSAETIPNHVAMMTGVYPDRNGIPTNNFWDREALPNEPGDEDLDNPNEVTAKTLFTWIDEQCRVGAAPRNPGFKHSAAMSKTYLWEVFRGDDADPQGNDAGITNIAPDVHWDPQTSLAYIGPGSEHTPDNATGPQAVSQLPDADFLFVNLGDVDRSSHAGGSAVRQGARTTADIQIGNLINNLKDNNRWENTIFIISSDHGMDFSDPATTPPTSPTPNGVANSVSTQPLLDDLADPVDGLTGLGCGYTPLLAVQNGGTNSIVATAAVTNAVEITAREDSLRAARACVLNFDAENDSTAGLCSDVVGANCYSTLSKPVYLDKIEHAWYVNPDLYSGNTLIGALASDSNGITPDSIKSRHENLGDLVLVMGDGYKFSEPDASGNPIPGNHGHLVTINNTIIIGGGADFLRTGQEITTGGVDIGGNFDPFDRAPEQSENVDVAATVAWLLGLDIQNSQFPDAGGSFPDYGDSFERDGFDGRILTEAFVMPNDDFTVFPSNCGLAPDDVFIP